MLAIIRSIGNFFDIIGTLIDFIINLISSLIYLLSLIPQCVNMLIRVISYLPVEVMAFASISITVSVIFLIVGRARSN